MRGQRVPSWLEYAGTFRGGRRMENRNAKRLWAYFLAIVMVLTGLRLIVLHDLRHQTLESAMELHVAQIRSDMDSAIEQAYSLQTLLVGVGGREISLEEVAPVLGRDVAPVRCIALAPGGVVSQVYPVEGNAALVGANLVDGSFVPDEESPEKEGLAITRPYRLPDGKMVIAARLPVEIPLGARKYEDWGMISVGVAYPDILLAQGNDVLGDQGFGYRISLVEEDGDELVVDRNFDGVKHSSELTFFLENIQLRLEAGSSRGWTSVWDVLSNFLQLFIVCGVLAVVLEIVSRQLRHLREEATQDGLTGLLNRKAGSRTINTMLDDPKFEKGAFLMMDLDYFKEVNDRFGHGRGDELLIECAGVLQQLFRKGDVLCRLGGDEFVVFLPFGQNMDFLDEKIETLLQLMRRDISHGEEQVTTSVSVGIAIAPEHGVSFDELYQNADKALYRSKERGRDCATLCGENELHWKSKAGVSQPVEEQHRVLVIGSDEVTRLSVRKGFSVRYSFSDATNSTDALRMVENRQWASILLDDDMEGAQELLKTLYREGVLDSTPVFLLIVEGADESARPALEMGVMDVILKPVRPYVVLRRVQSVIELFHARESLSDTVRSQQEQLRQSALVVEKMQRGIIEAMASAIEFRDVDSREHTNHIQDITRLILAETAMGEGFSPEEIHVIARSAITHDVGKIAISDVILNKPAPLAPEEFEIMKQHTVKGATLIDQLSTGQDHPFYRYAREIALYHHERWDGGGYPYGLKGEQIPVWAQVVAIADVYDALVSPRVYKKALTPEEAVDMILSGQCGQFNPRLLECFVEVEPQMREWYKDVSRDKPMKPEVLTIGSEANREVIDVLLLTAAVKSAFDMIICVNLTKNRFYMMDYDRFQTHCAGYDGVFDELIEAGASSVPEGDRERFVAAFNRESLIQAYAEGKKSVHLRHTQFTDDGRLMDVSTSVLFMEDPRTGDLCEITLSHYLGEIK